MRKELGRDEPFSFFSLDVTVADVAVAAVAVFVVEVLTKEETW